MFFNEIDPYCLKWLPKLFPEATVDGRSICDLRAADLAGHERIHLFGGLGGWELALRIAGWPESWPEPGDKRSHVAVILRARRNRVGRLRAYGNSIVPAVAALFVRVVMEYLEGGICER